ncbi:MAG TPA: ATP-binding protein [Gemmatimonadaceae bacterium]
MTRTGDRPTAVVGDDAATLFAGPGEMRALCRALDWAATPLGPVEQWSQSLRTMADAVLASRNPMLLFWGPDLVQLYNDALRPSLGAASGPSPRHPRALGMRAADFWTDVWHVVGPQIEGVMTRGEAVWYEDLHLPIQRDGALSDAWWTYSYSPVRDDDGHIAGTLVVCLETTGRVLAERRLQSLNRELEVERSRLAYVFRRAPTFLAVLRGSPEVPYVFELVNEAYARLVGHRPLVGRRVFDALPDVRGQGFEELLDRVVVTGEPFIGREVRITLERTPGAPPDELFLDFVYYPLVEADGSCSGVITHGVDVTEHVRARREVERLLVESDRARAAAERARAEAEAANRAKSEFLAMMSHELRTPLNAIDGYAELLELGIRGPLTEAQRHDLARIRRSQRHLLGLIDEVLEYTSVEAGRARYDIEDVPLDETLALCEALTAPQRRARRLSFHFDGCDPALQVRADRAKLGQIVLNLLTNAIKFTEPGGRVELACSADAERAYIVVSDTGRGIPRDQLERVFEPFVQVDARLTRAQEGVGLGLAISRDLARGMGGELRVRSTELEGSTFTLELPRA